MNQLIDKHRGADRRFRAHRVRLVELDGEGLNYPSKLDRGGTFIETLMDVGRARADWFFDARSDSPRARAAPAKSVMVQRTPPPRAQPRGARFALVVMRAGAVDVPMLQLLGGHVAHLGHLHLEVQGRPRSAWLVSIVTSSPLIA